MNHHEFDFYCNPENPLHTRAFPSSPSVGVRGRCRDKPGYAPELVLSHIPIIIHICTSSTVTIRKLRSIYLILLITFR